MDALTYVAGFVCREGQAAATLKQLGATLGTALVLGLLLKFVYRRYHSKIVLWVVGGVAFLIVVAVAVIGPFFYASLGCDNALLDLLVGDGY